MTAAPASSFPLQKAAVLAAISLANTASFLVTLPLAPSMILAFDPSLSEQDVGFRSGFLEGSYHLGALFGGIMWGHLSDTYGRRPCLLLGLAGTILCCLLFGSAKSFAVALIARVLWGFLNGNVGVVKTSLSEIVSDEDTPRAFSWIGVATGAGRIVGPAVGGLLIYPARTYPAVFGSLFWAEYPFLLPGLVAAAWTTAILIPAYFVLEETLPSKLVGGTTSGRGRAALPTYAAVPGAGPTSAADEDDDDADSGGDEAAEREEAALKPSAAVAGAAPASPQPLPRPSTAWSELRRFCGDSAIASACLLYTSLGLWGLVSNELFPIWGITPLALGGLSYSAYEIGMTVMIAGVPLTLYQLLVYDRIVARLGLMRTARYSLAGFAILMVAVPLCQLSAPFGPRALFSVVATHYAVSTLFRVSAFTCIFVFVANSALARDRGKANGLGQAAVSLARMLGPPLFSSLYAWSVSSPDRPFPTNYTLCWLLMGLGMLSTLAVTYTLPAWIERKRVEGA